MSQNNSHKTPSSSILDVRSPEYHSYWYERGRKIANKTVSLLSTEGGLLYPNVMPAVRKTLTFSTGSTKSVSTPVPDMTNLEVRDEEPVVKGFNEVMEVGTFGDLHLSPKLREIGFLPVYSAVFRYEDYPQSVEEHLNVAYLPAVLVDYVRPN
jgi:hypothetical protein